MADGNVSPVDSLDGDDRHTHSGVIKVASESLLAHLTTNSPSPYNSSAAQINTTDYNQQTDLSDYQYVNSDYDEDIEETVSFPEKPKISAQQQSPQLPHRIPKKNSAADKFVPPLVLTDSLIADDPETDGSKAVDDSLDMSMTDEDFARLENLMSSNKPLSNPFNSLSDVNGQTHTPGTAEDLRLSLTLVRSTTPRPIQRYMCGGPPMFCDDSDDPTTGIFKNQSDREQSVLSAHQQQEEQTTPRASQFNSFQLRKMPTDQQGDVASQQSQMLVSQQGQYLDGRGSERAVGTQQHSIQPQGPQSTSYYPTQPHMQYQEPYTFHQQRQAAADYQSQAGAAPQYQRGFVPSQYQLEQQMASQHQDGRHISQQYQGQGNEYRNQQPIVTQYQTGGPMPLHYQGISDSHVQNDAQQDMTSQYESRHPLKDQLVTTENNIERDQLNGMSQYQAQSYALNQHQSHPRVQYEQQPSHGMQQNYGQQLEQQLQYSQANNSAQLPTNVSPRSVRSSAPSEGNSKVVGTVAPKPGRPDKDFIERNINRARGVSSAKSGYATRLAQSRQQEEERKQWAPGMVIPRKKAASADNALRMVKPSRDVEPETSAANESARQPPQNVWEQRAMQLSQVKSRPAAKKRNGMTSTSRSKPETSRSSVASHESITESRVKLDVNLEPSGETVASSTHMRPIGPIPQRPERKAQEIAFASQPVRTYGPPSSVPQYESPEGSPRYHTQLTSTGHQLPSDKREVFAPVELDSYNQYYQSSLQSMGEPAATQRVETESRWNSRSRPPNFVSDGNDLTLEEIIALEHDKLKHLSTEQSEVSPSSPRIDSTHSGRELNPYQTVPPIHHQISDESGDGASQTYSQIHKSQREKEDKGTSYKTYTLKDYKKLNTEVKLGGLGPSADPNVLREKHELRQKQIQLAKQAREIEAKKAKAKAKEGKKEEKVAQPSGRQLAQEYSKTVPKPKVVSKAEPAAEPVKILSSARSLSKLNDIDQSQLTYRTTNSTVLAPQTSLKTSQGPGSINGTLPIHLANAIEPRNDSFPHSFSSPMLNQSSVTREQVNYMDAIDLLHKRHLEEKRLVAGIRQKI
ncbi:jhy protein homolog [Watersipora subatra]|uniref:jhy protein homolog n=1 Tax=Watersipora subatra TaxID=2589382 RepID=UPI00355BC35B